MQFPWVLVTEYMGDESSQLGTEADSGVLWESRSYTNAFALVWYLVASDPRESRGMTLKREPRAHLPVSRWGQHAHPGV